MVPVAPTWRIRLLAVLTNPNVVLGIGGIAAFVLGSILLFRTDLPGFAVAWPLIGGLAIATAVFILTVVGMALRARRRPVVIGPEHLVGTEGRVVEWMDGAGRVRVQGETWHATAEKAAGHGPAGPGHRPTRARADGRTEAGRNALMPAIETSLPVFVVAVLIAGLLVYAIRILREYERAVVFQLGRFWRVKGPGLVIIVPIVQQMVRVSLRTVVHDVPPQDLITRDNVTVKVNAVIYYRVIEPDKAVIQVENYQVATSQLAQTTLRPVLGQHQLDELLAERRRASWRRSPARRRRARQCDRAPRGLAGPPDRRVRDARAPAARAPRRRR